MVMSVKGNVVLWRMIHSRSAGVASAIRWESSSSSTIRHRALIVRAYSCAYWIERGETENGLDLSSHSLSFPSISPPFAFPSREISHVNMSHTTVSGVSTTGRSVDEPNRADRLRKILLGYFCVYDRSRKRVFGCCCCCGA